jgi:hypothetical protein
MLLGFIGFIGSAVKGGVGSKLNKLFNGTRYGVELGEFCKKLTAYNSLLKVVLQKLIH